MNAILRKMKMEELISWCLPWLIDGFFNIGVFSSQCRQCCFDMVFEWYLSTRMYQWLRLPRVLYSFRFFNCLLQGVDNPRNRAIEICLGDWYFEFHRCLLHWPLRCWGNPKISHPPTTSWGQWLVRVFNYYYYHCCCCGCCAVRPAGCRHQATGPSRCRDRSRGGQGASEAEGADQFHNGWTGEGAPSGYGFRTAWISWCLVFVNDGDGFQSYTIYVTLIDLNDHVYGAILL